MHALVQLLIAQSLLFCISEDNLRLEGNTRFPPQKGILPRMLAGTKTNASHSSLLRVLSSTLAASATDI